MFVIEQQKEKKKLSEMGSSVQGKSLWVWMAKHFLLIWKKKKSA